MIGPVLGAAMFTAWPLPVILLSDLVGALVAVLAIAFVKIPEIAAPPQEKHFLNEMKEGVKVYLRTSGFGPPRWWQHFAWYFSCRWWCFIR